MPQSRGSNENCRRLASADELFNLPRTLSTIQGTGKNCGIAQKDKDTHSYRHSRYDSRNQLSGDLMPSPSKSPRTSLCRGDFFIRLSHFAHTTSLKLRGTRASRDKIPPEFWAETENRTRVFPLPRECFTTKLFRQQLRNEILTCFCVYRARTHEYDNLLID